MSDTPVQPATLRQSPHHGNDTEYEGQLGLAFESAMDPEHREPSSYTGEFSSTDSARAVEQKELTIVSKKTRRVMPRPIQSPEDVLTKMDQVLLQVIQEEQTDGELNAGMTHLAKAVARKLEARGRSVDKDQTRVLRRTLFECRDRLKTYGFVTTAVDPTFEENTVYSVRSHHEVLSLLKSAGFTHYEKRGRGKRALTSDDVRSRLESE